MLLCLAAAVINLPFGYYRAGVRRFSRQWFLAVHFPVPLVIIMRLLSGESWRVIPLLVASAVLGQMAGGLLRPKVAGSRTEKIPVKQDEHRAG